MSLFPKHASVRGGIYLRLSKDDEAAGESESISNQRRLLLRYAAERQFTIEEEYADDGYSGTTFNRPGFSRMIRDVEDGIINLILTKDLSRLGRDYIQTGHYTELYFPSKGVRFIAVGDGYDSAFSSTDLIPFRNIVNEMYARDISRKIKASLQVKMDEGDFIGNFAPYGYEKKFNNRHVLTPDPGSAPIVKRIFEEAGAGAPPSLIAKRLNSEQVPCPSLYRRMKYPSQKYPSQNPLEKQGKNGWTANTIIKLLHNPVYLGHMVQGKTRKISFKSSLTVPVPAAERSIVPNTHAALVTEDLFLCCEAQLSSRVCRRH